MIFATKIRLKSNYGSASTYRSLEEHLLEIDEIFLTSPTWSDWFKKDKIHDYIKKRD